MDFFNYFQKIQIYCYSGLARIKDRQLKKIYAFKICYGDILSEKKSIKPFNFLKFPISIRVPWFFRTVEIMPLSSPISLFNKDTIRRV